MDQLDRMLGHDHWATAQLLEKSQGLTDAQLDQQFDIGHASLRETFDHLVHVIDFWTTQMTGQTVPRDREGTPSIAELIERHERLQAAFAACARQARDEQRLDDTFVDHFNYSQSIGATIIHLCYHNVQHRAEARHMLERFAVPELWDYDPQEWEHVAGHL